MLKVTSSPQQKINKRRGV